ncbi:MAC/perforin domain-containing protein [Bacteroides fragilis]|uniref:MAC/perforin domain-containing protein n=1 Tax=Bacteroides fragilis TaxID=817 RepID=UPI00189DDABC|nr:MAC/perforin domain-containing protein [Bacteroides fragilis]
MADDTQKFEFKIEYDYTENADPAKIKEVVKAGFGYGTNITNTIGNKQTAILDFEKIDQEKLIELDTFSKRTTIDREGSSYAEATEKINNEFGFSVNKGEVFGNTLRCATNNMMGNSDNYEYGIRGFLGKVLSANLKPVNNLRPYVLERVLKDIDGIAVNGKVSYPTDENSLKRLFDAYGTHVITKAIFGCSYLYYYLRESINQETSLHTQVDCNISGKFPSSKEGLGDLGINTNEQYSETYNSCSESKQLMEKVITNGGGNLSGSFAEWEAGLDFMYPNTIAMIGYIWKDDSSTTGLVPLWELVENQDRANQMKKAYEVYVKEHCQSVTKSKVVIVDVVGKHFGKGENAPDTLIMADYDGKNRKFRKISEEIMQHVKGSKKGSFYFYYTTDFSTNGGLTEIKFGNQKDSYESPWKKRGNNANEGVTGCLDDNIVLIKPADRSNYPSTEAYENDLIAGFGVNTKGVKCISDNSDVNFNWVTGGCDWYKGLVHDEIRCIYTKEEKIAVDEQK